MDKKIIIEWLEITALVSGLSAVVVITYFLIRHPYKCIIPFEPIIWIRIPEIIFGFFSIYFLIKIIVRRIKCNSLQ